MVESKIGGREGVMVGKRMRLEFQSQGAQLSKETPRIADAGQRMDTLPAQIAGDAALLQIIQALKPIARKPHAK